jgi:predicted signal transduction protein with EAL and GGDEF domain
VAEASREAAEAKRRELQERIGAIEIEIRPGKTLRLGASAGASVFPHDGATYEALLADADHRMYRDKAARRKGGSTPTLSPATPAAERYDDGRVPVEAR